MKYLDKVNKTPTCWLWVGQLTDRGYGRIYKQGKLVRAHREFYKLYKGEIPLGLLVCHTCDVRNCVNPEHLYLGTNADNMRDKRLRKRASSVGSNHKPVIDLSTNIEYISIKEAARETGIHFSHISRVCRGKQPKTFGRIFKFK